MVTLAVFILNYPHAVAVASGAEACLHFPLQYAAFALSGWG